MVDQSGDLSAVPGQARRPFDLLPVRVFLVALAVLLAGYMFMGRGFAHLGRSPFYVGEAVLVIGLLATAFAFFRLRLRPRLSLMVWLLLALMAWGLARTLPYLGAYGFDAMRDAVLWGYGIFALMVYVLVDRPLVVRTMRLYGWVVPVFALWLPISLQIFRILELSFDPLTPGSNTPLIYFKNADMAIHTLGALAFLVLGMGTVTRVWPLLVRFVVALPLAWAIFITGSANRGAFAALAIGLAGVAYFARLSRNWIPVLGATAVVTALLISPIGIVPPLSLEPSAAPTAAPVTPSPTTTATGSPAPTPLATPEGREVGVDQIIDNIVSIFVPSEEKGLEGTRQYRLRWWGTIINYTVFGPHFWTGKGFGVNLADDDGFQATGDSSLRAPHNSHFTALARMGVPGFALWVTVQVVFGIGLLRSVLAHRRAGDVGIAAVGAWLLVYWIAMLVNTSFDPYLEGPQGGIWFWSVFGLGMVVMRLRPGRSEA